MPSFFRHLLALTKGLVLRPSWLPLLSKYGASDVVCALRFIAARSIHGHCSAVKSHPRNWSWRITSFLLEHLGAVKIKHKLRREYRRHHFNRYNLGSRLSVSAAKHATRLLTMLCNREFTSPFVSSQSSNFNIKYVNNGSEARCQWLAKGCTVILQARCQKRHRIKRYVLNLSAFAYTSS